MPLPRVGQVAVVQHALLARRSLEDGELAYFVVFAPAGIPLQTLVNVAGQCWTIEECFEIAKDEVGLDEYEVRQWMAWYHHITLSMLTLAFLTTTRRRAVGDEGTKNEPGDLLPLTVSEVLKLFIQLLWTTVRPVGYILDWSV